ncbi:MAG: Gfo/Idh/MocA family oxidoreductase [Bacteroidales bacterium]|nr:Gfo/Idh/MocA family oxidoreductase [Bacteroidales bacterium]
MSLRIGIIGVGHFGKFHVKSNLEGKFDLAGIYDIRSGTSERISREYGVRVFESYEDLLKEVDAVDVVVPTISHFDVAAKAIEAGKHVFIEKPVTTTLEEAAQLKNLAEKHGVKIQVGHIERFNPAFTAVKDLIHNPKFIELHRLGPYHPRNKDVPVVLDLLIHDIDIVLSLVGSDVSLIRSNGVSIISDSPDIANARVEFSDRCIVNMTASRISLKKMRKVRLFQNDAYISIDLLEKKAEIVRINEVEGEVFNPFSLVLDPGNGKPKKQILFNSPDIKKTNAMVEELNSFYDAILQDRIPEVTIDDGYNALRLAQEIMNQMNIPVK